MTQVLNLAVLGSGQMGAGIAQVAAQTQKNVLLFDMREEALKQALGGIRKSLEKLSSKRVISESPDVVLERIKIVSDIAQIHDVDCVIEAVTENFATKTELFKKLDLQLRPHAIFASNTSSIPISELAKSTKRAANFIGMHFMNPVPLMKLVEVIPGNDTSIATVAAIRALAEEMGKTVVESRDRPGFIVNRVLMPMINEACLALEEKLATALDIDTAMKLGTNQPMGPLALADYIGLDTCLFIMGVMFDGLKEEKYRPAKILKTYVDAGKLGRKTSEGFFKYQT